MRKMFAVAVIMLVLVFAGSQVWAQTPWPDRSGKKAEEAVKTPQKAEAPVPAFNIGLNNLSGDVGLLWSGTGGTAALAPGIGIDLVNYKGGLLTLRGQAFFNSEDMLGTDNAAILGLSVMGNLIKAIGLIPDTSWLAKTINPSLGVFIGYDVVSGKPTYGPMLSIISVQF